MIILMLNYLYSFHIYFLKKNILYFNHQYPLNSLKLLYDTIYQLFKINFNYQRFLIIIIYEKIISYHQKIKNYK